MHVLASGDLLANRFEIEAVVGSGGMGTVFRAHDRHSDSWVAIKFLSTEHSHASESERFAREARLLAELDHPGIVRYIAHGVATDGRPYLAMEWLDGEDLAQRLRRGKLSVSETLTLLHKVAAALVPAHQSGIIHRDLKPSNIYLRDGSVSGVVILDFGIARRTTRSQQMTGTGLVIGTPDYMAPEQARSDRDLGPAADIFSLGCVVYECLCGEPPFAAEHIAAVLAKILFAAPAPLNTRQCRVPAALDELLMARLAKETAQRPPSATELVLRLAALPSMAPGAAEFSSGLMRLGLVGEEQRLLCVLMATPIGAKPNAATLAPDETSASLPNISQLCSQLSARGASLEVLADGSLVATLASESSEATDQAAQAVQCALLLRDSWPEAAVVVTTGLGTLGAKLPLGEAFNRAGQLLHAYLLQDQPRVTEPLLLDEVTAGLLGGHFAVRRTGPFFTLDGEAANPDATRPLLGQPTPCVGRESELGMLEGMLATCIEEETARAMLVTAPPGIGKSRLVHEFLRRIERRGLGIQVMTGKCDPLSAERPYGPLSQMLRRLCAVSENESPATRQAKLSRRVSQQLPAAAAQKVAEFLGEMCGIQFPDDSSIKLRAARQDPRVMADQMTQALLSFLRAECAVQPVLLLLEDLHWGDTQTARIIGAALRGLADSPFLVLALGRPEISDSFPQLWQGQVQQLALKPLSKKAGERLAQQLLTQRSAATIASIVERAAGNPLWLEELIRAVAEGPGEETPATLMAVLQARLGHLDAEARQILRAASIFGETFWDSGVAALLSGKRLEDLAQHLQLLVQRELLLPSPASRYEGPRELRFRHTLMREAAYSLLTEEDRILGHRLAGAYLEQQGELDPAILAEHAHRGADPERALPHYTRAAEQALVGNNITAALYYARAGLACAPPEAARGLFYSIEGTANLWGGELQAARAASLKALELLPRGSTPWFRSILALWMTTIYLGQTELFNSLRNEFRNVKPLPNSISAYVEAVSFLIVMTSLLGQGAESRFFLHRLHATSAAIIDQDAAVRGWVHYAHGVYCHWIENDLWLKAKLAKETLAAAELIGDRRMWVFALASLGQAQMGLLYCDDGIQSFRDAMSLAHKLPGETYLVAAAASPFALRLMEQRKPEFVDEAVALAKLCIDTLAPTAAFAGIAHVTLAQAYAMRDDLLAAQTSAEAGLRILLVEPAVCPLAFATLMRILVQRRDYAAAERVGTEALQLLTTVGSCCTAVDLLVAAAEVAYHISDLPSARVHLKEAARRLQASANRIPDLAVRTRYLTQVPLHAELLTRMRKLLAPLEIEAHLSLCGP